MSSFHFELLQDPSTQPPRLKKNVTGDAYFSTQPRLRRDMWSFTSLPCATSTSDGMVEVQQVTRTHRKYNGQRPPRALKQSPTS
ncbi:hypothetical protein JTE90_004721 [Oedothorax gibbosus]|uniref:Uncharacterized protein n=1 Tax=Oedothorax gibbosus TaxID=931172 RepID=A0AAV6UD09_9ARAC|nr:hypothetical protein JTE90_004721 [Oedothorax gibbosus]